MQRLLHADRGRSLLQTPCPVQFGTCWDHSFSELVAIFQNVHSNIPRYLLDFAMSSVHGCDFYYKFKKKVVTSYYQKTMSLVGRFNPYDNKHCTLDVKGAIE